MFGYSLRTQTYFRLSLVPPKITSANSSQRLISVFLFCCWPVKFTDRTWHSRTRASTLWEPAIILELEFVCNELWEHFNFRGFFLCKANVSSEEKIKVFGNSTVAIHSLISRSTEVDPSPMTVNNEQTGLTWLSLFRDVTSLWPLEYSSNKDGLERFIFPMKGGSLYISLSKLVDSLLCYICIK